MIAKKCSIAFETICAQQKKKNYEPLDHRDSSFDEDYAEFRRAIADVEKELDAFFEATMSLAPDIIQALLLVKRCVFGFL